MNKILTLAGVTVIILGGLYFINSYEATPQSNKLVDVTISQAFDVFLYAPLYVAEKQGYFAEQGINIKIVTAGGDDKAFATLVSGDAQFAVGDPTFVAIAGEQGRPGVVVGSILNGVPFWGIADKASIPTISTPEQLGTYSVATFPAPSTAYALQKKMFESANLQPNIKEVAFGALIPALKAGSVDVALELEPNVSTAVANGSRIVYSLSEYYPDFAITGISTLPEYVESNGEIVQKVINAIQKADDFIRDNPAGAAAIVAARFPDVSMPIATNALLNIVSANVIPENLVTSKIGWETAIRLRLDTGDLKQDAPFSTYIDNSFAEKAQ